VEKKKIGKADVEYLGNLARIFLTEEEKIRLVQDLTSILDYVSHLEKVNTEKVEPCYHVLPLTNVFREDKVEPSLPVEEALRNAPERSGDFFKVPKII